jgi:hemoglobin
MPVGHYHAGRLQTVADVHAEEQKTLFQLLHEEPGIRALVDTFYDRMDSDPVYSGIRALHPPELSSSRDKLFWFLCGWSGGPDHYISRFGHPRLRARHLPFSIGSAERDQWLACMREAVLTRVLEPVLQQRLLQSFHQTADWMRNQPDV